MDQIKQPLHFIGIGGSGMSALAELAHKRGDRVQGSDIATSANVQKLATLGISIQKEHAAEFVKDAGTVVYSSAIDSENPELARARDLGIPCLHRSEFLAHLMQECQAITVAGTHGKTTTSAMIGHVLDQMGRDPIVAIGGRMRRYGSAARAGKGPLFVAEADESDGSFLRYRPYLGVLANIDADHMDFFGNQEGLESAFLKYLQSVHEDGVAVIGWDHPLTRTVAQKYEGNRLTYGFVIGSEVRGINYCVANGKTSFDAIVERDLIPVTLPTLGKHNVMNALGTLAVVRALELDVKEAAEALATYQGVDRRLALIHEDSNCRIYDDYAHNPGKIAACINCLKEAYADQQLHVVYQPHRYSRLETMYEEMIGSLEDADIVHVLPVYAAGETSRGDYSPTRLARDINLRGDTKAIACGSFDEALKSVKKSLGRQIVVLTLGAGDIYKVAHRLRELKQKDTGEALPGELV